MAVVVLFSLLIFAGFFFRSGGYTFSGGRLLAVVGEGATAGGEPLPAAAEAPSLASSPASRSRPGRGVPDAGGRFKVMAFSVGAREGGGPPAAADTAGLVHNLRLKRDVYPDWQVRVYLDEAAGEAYAGMLEGLGCQVVRVPAAPGRPDQTAMWRLLAADDPTVSRFVERDTGARISLREARAVREWEADGTAFHSIRDSAASVRRPVVAGSCGGVGGGLMRFAADERARDGTVAALLEAWKGGDASRFMASAVWPQLRQNATSHNVDSNQRSAQSFCAADRPAWCHRLSAAAADFTGCTDEGEMCRNHVGADFSEPDLAADATLDCSYPAGDDRTVCLFARRGFLDVYREMAGADMPPEFT